MENNMKQIIGVLLSVLVSIVLFSCDGKDTPIPATQRIAKILTTGGAWILEGATVDGVDQLSLYQGLSVSFSETSYTTTNGGIQWPASGTWKFTDGTATVVERNDGLLITLEDVSETRAVISFDWQNTTFDQGRTKSLGGKHQFTLGH
jgi:hypothetical protein